MSAAPSQPGLPEDPELDFEGQGTLTRDMFEPHLGKDYSVHVLGAPEMTFTLAVVEATVHPGDRPLGGFVLLFDGPAEPHAMQGAVRMQDPDGQWFSIYLCNTGPWGDGMRYEAVIC